VFVIPPPVIQGIGNGGGYRMIVQDRSDMAIRRSMQAAAGADRQATRTRARQRLHPLQHRDAARLADIDRAKADMLGVPPERVFEALQVYLGSAYVNDFNLLGRTYRVTAQADAPYSRRPERDIAQLKTRSNSGAMVPIGSVATFQDKTGPYRVTRYNLFPAVEIDGDTAPGYSTGQAMKTMEKLAAEPAARLRDRMDRHRLPAEGGGQHRHPRLRPVGGVRLPGARGAVRKPDCCRWRSS
jgi:multidrug efflux pump subunit AcrB